MSFDFKLFYDFSHEMNVPQNTLYRPLVGYSVHVGGGSGRGVIGMPSRNFPDWTVGIHEEPQDNLCSGRGLNRISTEYE